MTPDLKALQILDKLFKEHDITYWLEGGTLIGAIRESDLLPFDHDIDVSVWFKDVVRIHLLQKEFNQYGYELHSLVRQEIRKINEFHHLVCIIPIRNYRGNLMTTELVHPLRKVITALMIAAAHVKILPPLIFMLSLLFSYRHFYFGKYKYLGNFAYARIGDNYYPVPEHVEKYLETRFSRWRTPCKGLAWRKREIENDRKYGRKKWSLM